MPIVNFPNLIGKIIHNCGAIELLINRAISALGHDSFLAGEVSRLRLEHRIEILRALLKERAGSSLSHPEVDSLCRRLKAVARDRNKIAHNPVASDDQDGINPYIWVSRSNEKITESELQLIVTRTRETMAEFVRQVTESTQM